MSKVMDTYKKYREPLLYIIVGGLTTLVNFAVYFLCTRQLGIPEFVSESISWVCSVSFAYFADKIVVFQSKSCSISILFKEVSAFVGARLATGAINLVLFYVLYNIMGLNDFWVKVFINVIVIIGNYLFSKFVIFKKPKID